jgi:uncharacterized membrane protein
MRVLIAMLALAACTGEPAPQGEAPAPAETSAAETAATQASVNDTNLAQVPSWESARAAGVDFRAVGQEPGWIVDIYAQDRIVALLDYGEQLLEFPLTAPTYPVEGATRYQTQANGRTLVVTIRRAPCQDAMSGQPYPSAVEVAIDGRTLNGCGRSV